MEGIVLSVFPYREKDAVACILGSDDQKYSMLVKSMYKLGSRAAAIVQKHHHIQFASAPSKGRGFDVLIQCELCNPFSALQKSLIAQVGADYICEWFEKNEEEVSFEMLRMFLETLAQQPMHALCLFQSYVNDWEGITPCVDCCVRCQSTSGIKAISVKDGGFLCGSCASQDAVPCTKEELYHFRVLGKITQEHYHSVNALPFNGQDFLHQLAIYEHYGSISLKSLRFLKRITAQQIHR